MSTLQLHIDNGLSLDQFYNDKIPAKNIILNGDDLYQKINNLTGMSREDIIFSSFFDGAVPDFIRNFKPIKINDGTNEIIYFVTNDYLSIGDDNNYFRIPMTPLTAQKIADMYYCTLPTKKMVMDIWKNSIYKIDPSALPPNNQMTSSKYYYDHNQKIHKQLSGCDYSQLISGNKKDIVLTNTLAPNNPNKIVAIYGWIQKNGVPIQGLNVHSHDINYVDYSHGVRLIFNEVLVNNTVMDIKEVFSSIDLCSLLSDEGVLNFTSY